MAASRERILITGAAGFIGACLTRNLIAAGHEVHALVRPGSDTWRLADVEGQYTRHRVDLLDGSGVRQAVTASRSEIIFHLAAHGAYSGQKHRATIMANTLLGTANLLDALTDCDYRVLVQGGRASIIDLRKDASPAAIDDEVAGMHMSALNAMLTRWTFRAMLLKSAYSREAIDAMVSQSRFAKGEISQDGIGFELRLTK